MGDHYLPYLSHHGRPQAEQPYETVYIDIVPLLDNDTRRGEAVHVETELGAGYALSEVGGQW